MIAHTTGDITAGSPLAATLLEHNPERRVRPIVLKIRKVLGKTGWLLRRIGWMCGAPDPTPEGLGHHALAIGAYVYEMTREETMIGQRLTAGEIWPSTVGEVFVGYTDFTDREIQLTSVEVEAWSRSRNDGKYHIRTNNCQHFVQELLRRIVMPLGVSDSETSSLKSISTVAKSTRVSEKMAVDDEEKAIVLDQKKTMVEVTTRAIPAVEMLQVPQKAHFAVTTFALPISCH